MARPGRALPEVVRLARRHWLLTLLLAAGLTLRILVQIAYQPAILYIDSTKYLLGAYPGDDPPGYAMVLHPLVAIGNLGLVATLQHLLGLGMAVALYAVLLRRGAPRWLSALAAAPVLLDAYQLLLEQMIMPDLMFEVLVVAGLVALLWEPRPRPWLVAAAGIAFGASATARQIGEILILPALLYLAIAVGGWRRRLQLAAVLCLAFALPILFGSYKNYVSIHRFSLAPYASGSIYGRMAQAADCATLKVPPAQQLLCPTPQQKLLGPEGLDHAKGSPIKTYRNPTQVRAFWHAVVEQQPLNVAKGVAKDAVKLFALTRKGQPGDPPITRWQFQGNYPVHPPYVSLVNGSIVFGTYTPLGVEKTIGTGATFGTVHPSVNRPLASFLRAYQLNGGYTPGPLFALTALLGLAGSLAVFRRRAAQARRLAALACLLMFSAGAAVLLGSDLFEFSWRYQLPALITLPPAAVLAITVLLAKPRGTHQAATTGTPARPAQAPGPAEPGTTPRQLTP
jgi:hypothetical protein